jgi:hypothetical protein
MFSWLSDLASGARALAPGSEVDRMLLESGLYEQIQGGTADFEVKLCLSRDSAAVATN